MIRKFKIVGLPKDTEFATMSLGRQTDHFRTIEAFKLKAKSIHLSQKRQSYRKAIREAIELYNVDQYYCAFNAGKDCYDDTFEFWFTVK